MKNEKSKAKSEDTGICEFTITVELQAGKRATFTYNDLELAGNHFDQLQARPVIGMVGIKTLTKSWRK